MGRVVKERLEKELDEVKKIVDFLEIDCVIENGWAIMTNQKLELL